MVYTGILAFLLLLFVLLLVLMFHPKKETETTTETAYVPGVYTSTFSLNRSQLNLEVVVDENHINAVSLKNLDESVSAMYPLLEPSLSDIETQLQNNVPIDEIQTNSEQQYTQTLLLSTIKETLEKAQKQ